MRVLRLVQQIATTRVFLDADPKDGLIAGEHFASQLQIEHFASDTYIFLVSADWLSSSWCLAEFRAALLKNGKSVAVLLRPLNELALPSELGAVQLLTFDDPNFVTGLRSALGRGRSITQKGQASALRPPTDQGEKLEYRSFAARVESALRQAHFTVEDTLDITRGILQFVAQKDELSIATTRIGIACWPRLADPFDRSVFLDQRPELELAMSEFRLSGVVVVYSSGEPAQYIPELGNGIKPIALDALENQVLRSREYLMGCASQYRSSQIASFIDLEAQEQDPLATRPNLVPNIANRIINRIASSERNFFFVIGDFGSGKTTVAEHVHKNIAQRYLSGQTTIFPTLFYLRTLTQFENEEKYAAHQVSSFSPNSPPDLLQQMRLRGPVLGIFDGFDEIASNSTVRERDTYFGRILRLTRYCSHVILTSRPTIFTNFAELNGLIERIVDMQTQQPHYFRERVRRSEREVDEGQRQNAQLVKERFTKPAAMKFLVAKSSIVTLQPLSGKKILEFFEPHRAQIKRRHKKTPEEVYEILLDVYDLSDIITRPLLLEMFIVILLEGTIDLDDPSLAVGPVSLYQDYINLHLYREQDKSPLLSPQARLGFSRAAARAMLDSGGTLEATYSSVEAVVRRTAEIEEMFEQDVLARDFEKIVTDVRVCGFLKITPDERIAFAHKSFMEFFVAESIYQKISEKQYADELETNLNYEILQFVGGFATSRSDFRISLRQHVDHLQKAVSDRYRMNLRIALLFADTKIQAQTFRDIALDGLVLRRRTYAECKFVQVHMSKSEWDRTTFEYCTFEGVSISGKMLAVSFVYCSGLLAPPELNANCAFNRCDMTLGAPAQYDGGVFDNSHITLQTGGHSELHAVAIRHCTMTRAGRWTLLLQRCQADSALFCDDSHLSPRRKEEPETVPMIQETGSSFKNCGLFAWRMNTQEWADLGTFLTANFVGLVIMLDPLRNALMFLERQTDKQKGRTYVGWHLDRRLLVVSEEWYNNHSSVMSGLRAALSQAVAKGESLSKVLEQWVVANSAVVPGAIDIVRSTPSPDDARISAERKLR